MLGQIVTVKVDRPLGSYHPKHKDIYYAINYGYIEGIMAADGEEQDAYIVGVNEPVAEFTGKMIAIIHRENDVEDKWVVAPEEMSFSKEEVAELVKFQEQYFETWIEM
nr:inorganic pyrophosphatase [Eubacterium sp.]